MVPTVEPAIIDVFRFLFGCSEQPAYLRARLLDGSVSDQGFPDQFHYKDNVGKKLFSRKFRRFLVRKGGEALASLE